jgi:hypothetical protein
MHNNWVPVGIDILVYVFCQNNWVCACTQLTGGTFKRRAGQTLHEKQIIWAWFPSQVAAKRCVLFVGYKNWLCVVCEIKENRQKQTMRNMHYMYYKQRVYTV